MDERKFLVVFCVIIVIFISIVHCQGHHRHDALGSRRYRRDRKGGNHGDKGSWSGGDKFEVGGGKGGGDKLNGEQKREFEKWKKKYSKRDDDKDEFLNWKNRKNLGISDEHEAEFEKWKTDKGKTDKHIAEFLLWKTKKHPAQEEKQKEEKKEDELRGTCFAKPTKLMRTRIEHCKCEILHNLTSFVLLPDPMKDQVAKLLGNPKEKKNGKRKKCKFPPILSTLEEAKKFIPFLIRVCFWKRMKMLSTDDQGKTQMNYDVIKEIMGEFESKPEIIKALRDGIDNCVESPIPESAPPLPKFVGKFMSAKDFRKCECIGLLYQKHCTDVGNGGDMGAKPTIDASKFKKPEVEINPSHKHDGGKNPDYKHDGWKKHDHDSEERGGKKHDHDSQERGGKKHDRDSEIRGGKKPDRDGEEKDGNERKGKGVLKGHLG